jgi:DNA-binding beta-propeller fold protein YncE
VIQGPKTLQARTSHYIAIDSIHDELVVPNPFAQALLTFHGGVNGNEAPIRVIQGPKTLLNAPDNVAIDPVHKEIYTAAYVTDAILVYRSDIGGNVAPIRILHGPKTMLDRPIRVEVDPVNNIMAVVTDHSLVMFKRTAEGDEAPLWVISGPKTGVGTRFGTRDIKLYPEGKKIFAGAGIRPPRGERGAARSSEAEDDAGFFRGGQRFVGVWKYGDVGDVPPWAALNYNQITSIPGSRLAIDPEGGDLIAGGDGQVSVYHIPEVFQKVK